MNPETHDEPLDVIDAWIAEAAALGVALPEAMTLATVSEEGAPSARIVLYKGRSGGAARPGGSGDGLAFFTNYESRKARELEKLPRAALVFHWASLQRQVRVEGTVEKVSAEESDAYFATRPRESQLGAWASPQSESIDSREVLEEGYEEVERRFEGQTVPRPPHWGGYRVIAERVELWIGRGGRLHDRYLFVKTSAGWKRSLLAP